MGLTDKIFGGTKQVSTLNKDQEKNLKQLSQLNIQYNPMAYKGLADFATGPSSTYKFDEGGMDDAFNAGVLVPGQIQLNKNLANNNHSSMLHSSANRIARDNMVTDFNNNIQGLRYQNMLNQQKLEQEADEAEKQRQLSALSGLLGGNAQVLGTHAVYNQKEAGLLDLLSAGTSVAKGVKSLF